MIELAIRMFCIAMASCFLLFHWFVSLTEPPYWDQIFGKGVITRVPGRSYWRVYTRNIVK